MTFLDCYRADYIKDENGSAMVERKEKVQVGSKSMKIEHGHGRNSIARVVKTLSLRHKGKKKQATDIRDDGEHIFGCKKISAQPLTFRHIVTATDNFSPENLLGEGGFGRVYKGYLRSIDKVVAVKHLDKNGLQGNREFLAEVFMLSLLDHPNLVDLIGYCADGDERVLVYEYMSNGSLDNHLFDLPASRQPLDWHTRMKIAHGAAKGLEYLHETASPPVIYRDFKASNILLDGAHNPRLSDFGLARIGPSGDKNHVSTRVMGTYGYCAPEYARTGQLTTKSDVFSFGVVFLELISGRRAIDKCRPPPEQNLVAWARPFFKDRNMFTKVLDPLLGGKCPTKSAFQALAVAAMCLQEEADIRPFIGDVVTALKFLANPGDDLESPRGTTVNDTKNEDTKENFRAS